MKDQDQDLFNLDYIRQLADLMKEKDLNELEFGLADQHIRLRYGSAAPMQVAAAPAPVSAPADSAAPPADDPNVVTISSPFVGTFYCRPNPESSAFVKVGDHVGKDTTVCIIEALKVFNEVPAEVSGQIVAVLAENEETVEFGRPLFKVDTSK